MSLPEMVLFNLAMMSIGGRGFISFVTHNFLAKQIWVDSKSLKFVCVTSFLDDFDVESFL